MQAELAFVSKALSLREERKKSSSKKLSLYDGLVQQIEATDAELTAEEMSMKVKIFEALAREAPRLVGQAVHKALLEAMFRAVLTRRAPVIRALGVALASVVSLKSTLVGRASRTLAKIAASGLEDHEALSEAFLGLLDICPRGTAQLFEALKGEYPWSGKATEAHASYVAVLLTLARRQPLLEPFILDLVVTRAIEIDVQVDALSLAAAAAQQQKIMDSSKTETQGAKRDDDKGDNVVVSVTSTSESLFELDLDDKKEEEAPIIPAAAADGKKKDSAATKLDRLMCLLLGYAEARLESSSDAGEALFLSGLEVFEASVLHTHQSKFVQFLFFKVATSSRERSAVFASRLVDVAADEAAPRVTRLSAVSYLASFVCRAKSVDATLAALYANRLFCWAEDAAQAVFGEGAVLTEGQKNRRRRYREEDDSSLSSPDQFGKKSRSGRLRQQQQQQDEDSSSEGGLAESFAQAASLSPQEKATFQQKDDAGLFAIIFQALLYVACFRGDELFRGDEKDSKDSKDSAVFRVATPGRWQRLLAAGNADGLRRCDQRIRAEFLEVCDRANAFPKAYLASLSCITAGSLGNSKKQSEDTTQHKGDAPRFFFPFDPYLLPESRSFISETYRHWSAPREDHQDSDTDDDDDSDDGLSQSPREQHSFNSNHMMFSPPSSLGQQKRIVGHSPTSRSPSVMSLDGGHSFLQRPRLDSIGYHRPDESW